MLRVTNHSEVVLSSGLNRALQQKIAHRLNISDEIFGGLIATSDFVVVTGVAAIAYVAYLENIVADASARLPSYVAVTVLAAAFLLQRLALKRAYVVSEMRNTPQDIKRVIGAWSLTV